VIIKNRFVVAESYPFFLSA